MDKRVSINSTFFLKNPSKDYRGITRANFNFGKDEKFDLSILIGSHARELANFYASVMPEISDDELNEELIKASTYLKALRFGDNEKWKSGDENPTP